VGRISNCDAEDFVDDCIHRSSYHNTHSALFEPVVSDGSLAALCVVSVEIES
jgi:hypothetical protein